VTSGFGQPRFAILLQKKCTSVVNRRFSAGFAQSSHPLVLPDVRQWSLDEYRVPHLAKIGCFCLFLARDSNPHALFDEAILAGAARILKAGNTPLSDSNITPLIGQSRLTVRADSRLRESDLDNGSGSSSLTHCGKVAMGKSERKCKKKGME
jgi:hypothetical protein